MHFRVCVWGEDSHRAGTSLPRSDLDFRSQKEGQEVQNLPEKKAKFRTKGLISLEILVHRASVLPCAPPMSFKGCRIPD